MTPTFHAEQAPASATFAQACVTPCEASLSDGVGQPLTDDAREEAIKRAGQLMLRKHADFARTGNLADLGDAHRAMLLLQRLRKGVPG